MPPLAIPPLLYSSLLLATRGDKMADKMPDNDHLLQLVLEESHTLAALVATRHHANTVPQPPQPRGLTVRQVWDARHTARLAPILAENAWWPAMEHNISKVHDPVSVTAMGVTRPAWESAPSYVEWEANTRTVIHDAKASTRAGKSRAGTSNGN